MFGFSSLDELREALVLGARHSSISSFLDLQIFLEMLVEVLLECGVSHEAHSANSALKLDSLENFILSRHSKSDSKKCKENVLEFVQNLNGKIEECKRVWGFEI